MLFSRSKQLKRSLNHYNKKEKQEISKIKIHKDDNGVYQTLETLGLPGCSTSMIYTKSRKENVNKTKLRQSIRENKAKVGIKKKKKVMRRRTNCFLESRRFVMNFLVLIVTALSAISL